MTLSIGNADLDDLQPISELPIRSLELKDCKLKSLEGIQTLDALTYLDIQGNFVTDYQPIVECKKLKQAAVRWAGKEQPAEVHQEIDRVKKLLPDVTFKQ